MALILAWVAGNNKVVDVMHSAHDTPCLCDSFDAISHHGKYQRCGADAKQQNAVDVDAATPCHSQEVAVFGVNWELLVRLFDYCLHNDGLLSSTCYNFLSGIPY